MKNGANGKSFQFMTCWELREMLGRHARDVRELLEGLEEAPVDSIHFHTHSCFLRHRYIAGPYPNDFATWAAMEVRDRVLGERLAVVDPFEFRDLETLRGELISIVDDHLSSLGFVPRIGFGEPFFFEQSRILAVSSGLRAHTLTEFREVLETVDASAVYYHVFEALGRRGRRRSDFAIWIEETLGLPGLAARLDAVNPYATSLEGLRGRLVQLCREAEAEVAPIDTADARHA